MSEDGKSVDQLIDELICEIQNQTAASSKKYDIPMEDIVSSSSASVGDIPKNAAQEDSNQEEPQSDGAEKSAEIQKAAVTDEDANEEINSQDSDKSLKAADEPSYEEEPRSAEASLSPASQNAELAENRRKAVANFELAPDIENKRLRDFDPAADDYESVRDAKAVMKDLDMRLVSSKTKLIVTSFITAIIAVIMYFPAVRELTEGVSDTAFLIINTVLAALLVIVNASAVFGGIGSVFRLKADIDSPVAFSGLAVLVTNALYLFFPDSYAQTAFPLSALLFGTALIFNDVSKSVLIRRIKDNFYLVANDKEKYAVNLVDGENCEKLTNGHITDGPIACRKKTVNLLGFLNNSFSDDPVSRLYRVLTYVILAVAAVITVLAVVYGKAGTSAADAAGAFTYILMLTMPFASLLSAVVPLSECTGKLRKKRILINGFSSVEKFSKCKAIALADTELFTDGTVQLVSFEAHGDCDIDEVLISACALMKQCRGTMTQVFDSIITGHTGALPKVENCGYDEGKGYAGIVGGKPVLVGNASLMDKYGIKGYDSSITGKVNRFRLYISVDRQLCAQLVIRYLPDRHIAKEIRLLADYGKTVCITTNDQNISKRMISRLFKLDESCIEIITGENHELLKKIENFEESFDGSVAFFGRSDDFMGALNNCMKLRVCYGVTRVTQVIMMLAGALIGAASVFLGIGVSCVTVLIFQAVSAVVCVGFPMLIAKD